MNRNTGMNAGQIIGTMNGRQVVGLDIAKQVFQLHTVDMGTGEISNVQLKRAKVMEHFARRQPCLIAMEACGSAHHWARELTALGHSVRLLHAKIVRPFVSGNKTDATDTIERARVLGYETMPRRTLPKSSGTVGLPKGTWYYRVSAVSSEDGESLPSLPMQLLGGEGKITVCWGAPPLTGTYTYNVYRSLASDGRASSERLLATRGQDAKLPKSRT